MIFKSSVLLTVLILATARSVHADLIPPMSLDDTVREASAVFLGRVIAVNFRWGDPGRTWLQTDYVLEVEDAILENGPIRTGNRVTLTFWGGKLLSNSGDKPHTEVQLLDPYLTMSKDDRYVLMLHRDWQKAELPSPLVGFSRGFFPVVEHYGAKGAVVVDHDGYPVLVLGGTTATKFGKGLSSKAIPETPTLKQFLAVLRTDLPRMKALPKWMPPYAKSTEAERVDLLARPVEWVRTSEPQDVISKNVLFEDQPLFATTASPPEPPVTGATHIPATVDDDEKTLQDSFKSLGILDPRPKYVSLGNAIRTPISFNVLPETWKYGKLDLECMRSWNFYTPGLFKAYRLPKVGWGNGRSDIHGWLDNKGLKEHGFNYVWPGNVLAFCLTRLDDSRRGCWWEGPWWNRRRVCNFRTVAVIESDIVFNKAFSFTRNSESLLDGSNSAGFQQTCTHELGHAVGLAHNFNDLAIMNYAQHKFRAYSLPFYDDAAGARKLHANRAATHRDLAVYLFYSVGYQKWRDARIQPTKVKVGDRITISNYTVCNAGTVTIDSPTIEWWLSERRSFGGREYFLGKTTFGSLRSFSHFKPSEVSTRLTIPSNMPPGQYYIGAFIRNDESPKFSSFPYDNNRAFSTDRIQVRN